MGNSSYAHGPNDTALGSNARVDADGSTAVGANTHITAAATNAVAVGESASVSAASGTAVGQGASVTAQGAVALGQGSVADRANTVSVGSAGQERQITNVAAGTQATDAVNKGQLDQGVASANSYTDTKFGSLTDSFTGLRNDMDNRLRHIDRRIDRQGAMNAAMLNMATSAAGVRTPNRVGVGVGFQSGESALSIGYQRAISDRATVTLGGAFSSDDSSVGVGAGFGW
ncbi:YadA-like family protein [Stenotrophomonas sp. STM01]|nr:YadA-like family protein [Stenotrophomonas sp. STM01]